MADKGVFRRDNIKLVVLATVCLVIGLSAPAIGHGVHARFAHNADKVDGFHANALVRADRMGTGATPDLTTTPQAYGSAVKIRAPRKGFVLVTGNVTVRNVESSCTVGCTVTATIRHIGAATSIPSEATLYREGTTWTDANIALNQVFNVSAGVNKFDIQLERDGGSGTLQGDWGSLQALFVPFGPGGGSPS